MYELTRISLHNWYLIDALDIRIDGHTAVIGQTGAGKSSILDAIQTVISGNNRNMLELNAAAGNERSRSVRDYMLGCVSDVNEGKPRRERAESTLVLTFTDKSKKSSIAIGLFMKADQNNAETTRRFVAPGYNFKIEDHMSKKGSGEVVDSHEKIIERLRDQVPGFAFYTSSTKYVSAYLGEMRPELPPDSKHFMRAFSNALLTKEISDPTDFMRRFVLEPIPLDMKGVKSSIEIWREMTGEVERVENMISDLSMIAHNYQTGFGIMLQEADIAILERKLDTLAQRLKVRALSADTDKLRAKDAGLIQRDNELTGRVAEIEKEVEALREILRGSDAGNQVALVDAELRTCLERQNGIRRQVEGMLQPLVDLKDLDRETLPELVRDLAADARYLASICANKTPEEWAANRSDITSATKLILDHSGISGELRTSRDKISDQASKIRDRLNEIGDVSSTSSGPPLYSRQVRDFMATLDRAGIEHAILPELVEVTDTSWTFALEALLGPNREALLVADDDLSAAFDLLFKNRNQFDTVRLINTRRLRQGDQRRSQDSIADIVVTENDDIRRFIDYSVGRYVRAEDDNELTSHRAAILRNGKTNSGATVRVFRDRSSILGKGAREKASEAIVREASEIRSQLSQAETSLSVLDSAITRYGSASTISHEDLDVLLAEFSGVLIEARALRQKKTAIDDTKASEAEEKLSEARGRLASLKPDLEQVRKDRRSIEVQIAVLGEKIAQSNIDIDSLSDKEDEAIDLRASENMKRLEGLVQQEADHDLMDAEDFAALLDMPVNSAKEALTGYRARVAAARASLVRNGAAPVYVKRGNNGLLSFAQKWLIEDAPLAEDTHDEDRFAWVSRKLERYRANDLLQYRERLEQARDEMESSLKEGLVSKLGEQFALLKQQVDSLNRRLERHQFVGQTYQFRSSVSARFLPIYDLVQTALDPEGDLESEEARAGLADLEAILESDDDDIKRFGDYRNYFTFELYIEHPDPKDPATIKSTPLSAVLGKLSGGQRQAPYYVAIAASMVSAYYPKSHAGDTEGMGLTLFDEAFNRLDIPNTQRLMGLFRALGLQVVVAVPEDKRATLIEAVDSVITVSRIPATEDVFIDTSGIGPKAKEAMLKENPVHQPVPA